MARDIDEVLSEILQAIEDIRGYVEDLDVEGLARLEQEDRKTFRAIKNAISEIGEAIKQLPVSLTSRYPAINWRGLAGLRDIVAHSYFRLDAERLWPVLVEELPELAVTIEAASVPWDRNPQP